MKISARSRASTGSISSSFCARITFRVQGCKSCITTGQHDDQRPLPRRLNWLHQLLFLHECQGLGFSDTVRGLGFV